MLRFVPKILVLLACGSCMAAQEASYNEDRVAPSRVPPSFLKVAEKEAPGVRFATVYRDQEKGYRFTGKAADGKTFSVRIDREGAVEWRRTYGNVLPEKLPKDVAATLRDAMTSNPKLSGFRVSRMSLVERYLARKNETVTFYEIFGESPDHVYPRIEIDPAGKLVEVDTSFTPSTDDYLTRVSLTGKDVPPVVMRGLHAAAPGIKIARLFRMTSKGSPEVSFEAYGWVDRGRAAHVSLGSNGNVNTIAVTMPLRDVPKKVVDAIATAARMDPQLVNFRPTEARKLHLAAFDEDQFQLFGDDPEGNPIDVRVKADGEVITISDGDLVIREEAGTSSPEQRPKPVAAVKAYTVLAARYGVDHHWIDVTSLVAEAVAAGRPEYTTEKAPDPAVGRRKTTVILYAMDGKVGLAHGIDNEPMPLTPRQDPSTLAVIPAQGFAVLAARFGIDDAWQDVTASVKPQVADGRLNIKPVNAKLVEVPGDARALAVAYAIDGKVGLYVQSQWRSTNLPPEGSPANSGDLLARSIEFPQPPSLAAFTSDGRFVAVGVADGSVRMIDAATGREAHRFDGHDPGWVAVAVAGNGSLLVSGGQDKVVRIWDVKADREKAALRGHTERIYRVAIAPSNRYAASTSFDKTVRLWDLASGGEIRQFEGHTDFVNGLRFSPDGKQLVTASWDRSVRIWDVATGREVKKLEVAGDALGDVAVSRTGRDIFFGAKDGLLRWWEPAVDRPPTATTTDTEAEVAIAAFPDGHRVLIADKTAAVLWDCKTAHPVLRLEQHTDLVTGVAVAPNGRRAATCGQDNTLKIWNLPDLGR